jgi:hypothetical protein
MMHIYIAILNGVCLFEELINKNVKVVFKDGDNTSIFYGKLLNSDSKFIKILNNKKISYINNTQIHKIEADSEEVLK